MKEGKNSKVKKKELLNIFQSQIIEIIDHFYHSNYPLYPKKIEVANEKCNENDSEVEDENNDDDDSDSNQSGRVAKNSAIAKGGNWINKRNKSQKGEVDEDLLFHTPVKEKLADNRKMDSNKNNIETSRETDKISWMRRKFIKNDNKDEKEESNKSPPCVRDLNITDDCVIVETPNFIPLNEDEDDDSVLFISDEEIEFID